MLNRAIQTLPTRCVGALSPRPGPASRMFGVGAGRGRPWRLVLDLAAPGGWPSIALVAVNDAVGFWQGHGFAVRQTPAMAAKLASYGADARYMSVA